MATLPPLVPNEYIATSGSAPYINTGGGLADYWANIDEDPDGTSDGNYIYNSVDNGSGDVTLGLTNTPADFASMDTMEVRFRAEGSGYTDDTGEIAVKIIEPGTNTAYAGWSGYSGDYRLLWSFAGNGNGVTVATASLTVTSAGLAASKEQWDAARLVIYFTNTRNMGGDGGQSRLHAIEINGTYTTSSTPATVTPTAVAATTAVPTPTIDVGAVHATPTPATVAAVAQVPAPTPSTGSAISPTTPALSLIHI